MTYKYTVIPDELSRFGWYWRVYKVEKLSGSTSLKFVSSGYSFTKRGALLKAHSVIRSAKRSAASPKKREVIEKFVEL